MSNINDTASGSFPGSFTGVFTGLFRGQEKGLFLSRSLYQYETILWYNQLPLPKPSVIYLNRIDALIKNLKEANIWNSLDRLWVFATEQRAHATVSLVNPTSTAITEVNTPTWTRLQGYTGNGSSAYLNTHFVPSGGSQHYSLNNCSLGIYSRTPGTDAGIDFGASDTGSVNFAEIALRYTNNNSFYLLNATTAGTLPTVQNGAGFFMAKRLTAQVITSYRNGITLATTSQATASATSNPLYILGRNTAGTAASFTSRQYSMAFCGGGVIDAAAFYSAFQRFALENNFNV